jgi:hypothetical protein
VDRAGKRLVVGSNLPLVLVWDLEKRKVPLRLPGHEGGSQCAAFAPDGRIATGDNKGKVRIWNASGVLVKEFNAHQGQPVLSVTFSADGKNLLTSGGDRAIRFWPGADGTAVLPLTDLPSKLFRADLAPDGRRAVVAGWDGVLRVYDLTNGHELHHWAGHKTYVTDAVFTPDGTQVVSASGDKTVRLWKLPPSGTVPGKPPDPPVKPPASGKRQPPAGDVLVTVQKQVRAVVTARPPKDTTDWQKLAGKLRDKAGDMRDRPDLRFVYLTVSRDAWVRSGNVPEAMKMCALLESDYDVNPLEVRCAGLEKADRAKGIDHIQRELTLAALDLFEQALEKKDYAVAARLVVVARKAAARTREQELIKKAGVAQARLETARKGGAGGMP